MVSIENYKCFCKEGALERFESKEGRGFVKCSKECCTLFVPEEKYLDLMDAYEKKYLISTSRVTFQSAIAMKWQACGYRTLRRIQSAHILDVKILTRTKSVVFSNGHADSASKVKKGKRKTDSGKEKLPKERKVRRAVKRKIESSSDEAEQN